MTKCKKCGFEGEEENFIKGKFKCCKPCNNKYRRECRKRQAKNPEYIKRIQKQQRAWWKKNREWGNERQRKYRKNNTNFQLSNALRARVKYALIGCTKADKTFDLLGCSPREWKAFLENKFDKNMNWDNYGTFWEVDHIVPVSRFDLTDSDEQRKAFHFSNTQPLTIEENRRKGNRI